jgi:hypothetical protein
MMRYALLWLACARHVHLLPPGVEPPFDLPLGHFAHLRKQAIGRRPHRPRRAGGGRIGRGADRDSKVHRKLAYDKRLRAPHAHAPSGVVALEVVDALAPAPALSARASRIVAAMPHRVAPSRGREEGARAKRGRKHRSFRKLSREWLGDQDSNLD